LAAIVLFFILNKPCFVSGRGETLENFPLDLKDYSFLLVHPGIHISTREAFSKIKPAVPLKPIREILQNRLKNGKIISSMILKRPLLMNILFE